MNSSLQTARISSSEQSWANIWRFGDIPGRPLPGEKQPLTEKPSEEEILLGIESRAFGRTLYLSRVR